MATHPLVLLVQADPLLRELIHGELKEHGCIVVGTDTREEALSFAALYPGAIDLAITDRPQGEPKGDTFVSALRALPPGRHAPVLQVTDERSLAPTDGEAKLIAPFERQALLDAVQDALTLAPSEPQLECPGRSRAVFWGSERRPAEDTPAVH